MRSIVQQAVYKKRGAEAAETFSGKVGGITLSKGGPRFVFAKAMH